MQAATARAACRAANRRPFDRDRKVEDPAHIEALRREKVKAELHRNQQALMHAAPQAQTLLGNLARQGVNLGSAVAALLTLLDSYGALALQQGIDHALAQRYHGVSTVRRYLEQLRTQARMPPVAQLIPLPAPLAASTVVHKSAVDYDKLAHKGPHSNKE